MDAKTRERLLHDLARFLQPDQILSAPHDLLLYGYDGVVAGDLPDLVVLPTTTEEVSQVLRLAHEGSVSVTPRGAGTCLSGGPVPAAGGIVVALTRMDGILEIDLPNQRAVVQPGVVNLDLLSALEPSGYWYAPDPASQLACTIGGNVAENAGGPHCLKYGVTVNHVTGLQMVLADGTALSVGGKAEDGPGYDLIGPIVGSEGTFGIVTEVTCRITPRPQDLSTVLAVFSSMADAVQTVSDVIAAGLLPATLEMMDRPMIQAVQAAFDAGYPPDAEAVLIIEVDGLRASTQRQLDEIRAVCERNGVSRLEWARDEEERERLWRGRKGAMAALVNIRPNTLCTDIAVPRGELPEVLAEVKRISAEHGVPIGCLFHAGDGNLHPQVLYDARNPAEVETVRRIDAELVELAVAHGGVLSGEHGIGSCKLKWMPVLFAADDLRAQWKLKDVFDPGGRMNPAKVLPARDTLEPPRPVVLPDGDWAEVSACLECQTDATIYCPADPDQLAKLMALASRENRSIEIVGGTSKTESANGDRARLATSRLARIISVDADNLTVTTEAGVRWRDLQAELAQIGQFVPMRPAAIEEATVGGVVATNADSLNRMLYGSCRDQLLGARVAMPTGEVITSGSRCVKNASGYALEKLFVGSQGTIGALVEVTFRTKPLPDVSRALCYASPDGAFSSSRDLIKQVAARVFEEQLTPAALVALSPGLVERVAGHTESTAMRGLGNWMLVVGLEGLVEEVEDMTAAVGGIAVDSGLRQVLSLEGQEYEHMVEALVSPGRPLAKAAVAMSDALDLAGSVLDRLGSMTPMCADLGTGVVLATPAAADEEAVGTLMSTLAETALESGGRAFWLPPAPSCAVATPLSEAELRIWSRLKKAYDAQGILPDLAGAYTPTN